MDLPEGNSVDQQVLKLLVDPPAIIDTYLGWKDFGTQVKQLITFRDAINPATGRIHASFIQYGADSGRFTCRQPNCQNPSKHAGLRESVKPRPGHKFLICDYSGVEMRLMAALANDATLIKAIKDGVDIHRFTASGILKKPMDEISKNERSQGKVSGFALIYACSAETLKDYAKSGYGVDMTQQEADRNREGFFELYSGIAAFHARTKKELYNLKNSFERDPEGAPPTYETRTLAGRRRTLPYGSMTAQTATNSPTQGSGADCLLLAMGRLRKAWDDAGMTGWRIVNSIHDEIVAEGPESQAEAAAEILQQVMEDAGNELVPIRSDRYRGRCRRQLGREVISRPLGRSNIFVKGRNPAPLFLASIRTHCPLERTGSRWSSCGAEWSAPSFGLPPPVRCPSQRSGGRSSAGRRIGGTANPCDPEKPAACRPPGGCGSRPRESPGRLPRVPAISTQLQGQRPGRPSSGLGGALLDGSVDRSALANLQDRRFHCGRNPYSRNRSENPPVRLLKTVNQRKHDLFV